jgi:hypothetical protein
VFIVKQNPLWIAFISHTTLCVDSYGPDRYHYHVVVPVLSIVVYHGVEMYASYPFFRKFCRERMKNVRYVTA